MWQILRTGGRGKKMQCEQMTRPSERITVQVPGALKQGGSNCRRESYAFCKTASAVLLGPRRGGTLRPSDAVSGIAHLNWVLWEAPNHKLVGSTTVHWKMEMIYTGAVPSWTGGHKQTARAMIPTTMSEQWHLHHPSLWLLEDLYNPLKEEECMGLVY